MIILLLTDNLMTRANLEATWKNAGATVAGSSNNETEVPDLIVVDLTAKEAVGRIRALRARYPAIEILAFGPHVDSEAFKQAKEAGATRQVARGKVVERVLARVAQR
jgi:DNA-binding NarL/FixJ family response regulator